MADAATQRILEIDKIKEGVIILRNKALRGVLMVSSSNFALKSEDEQNALISSYVGFLNSIDFPLQVGDSSSMTPIMIALGIIVFSLISVNVLQRRRLMRDKIRSVRNDESESE